MIAQYIATWAELQNLLTKQSASIYAPKRATKAVIFHKFSPADFAQFAESDLDLKSTSSAKQAVMPQSETLFKFSATKDSENLSKLNQTLEACTCAEASIVFATRACDARAFAVLDLAYMSGPYCDPYYKAKREALTIITKSCPKMGVGCFCQLVGSNPCDSQGSDITFAQINGKYILNAITEKGEKLLSGLAKADEASIKAYAEMAEQAGQAETVLSKETADLLASRFEDLAFWQNVSQACLGCGACTYVCPTCQCFNITDEGDQYNGSRLRNWDSCMKSSFTKEASSHNPRNEGAKRWRNRLNHKFNFFPKTHDKLYACVGCGRCLKVCPVNIDIQKMLLDSLEGATVKTKAPKIEKVEAKVENKAEAKPAPTNNHHNPAASKKKK